MRYFNRIIDELLQEEIVEAVPIKWRKLGDDWQGKFLIDPFGAAVTYDVRIRPTEIDGSYRLDFRQQGKTLRKSVPVGARNTSEIIATVKEAIREFLHNIEPESLVLRPTNDRLDRIVGNMLHTSRHELAEKGYHSARADEDAWVIAKEISR